MATWTIYIIPLVFVIVEGAKSVYTIFIVKVVWLTRGPVTEVQQSSVTPNERSFGVDVGQTKPAIFSTV